MSISLSMRSFACVIFGLIVVLLSACGGGSRYKMEHDAAPKGQFDASQVPDVEPKWEPLSPGGNKSPYKVRGKTYELLPSAEGYVEEGVASWYGLKFHGELTSNGETYNMYAMTAAHKSLPLPAYLKVTNLENGKAVVLRVNDRGPFHGDRIIDLSYAAAKKLGYADKGTARVRLEAITLPGPKFVTQGQTGGDRLMQYVQVAALGNQVSADTLSEKIKSVDPSMPVFVAKAPGREPDLFRVRIGPFESEEAANLVHQKIRQMELGNPMVITRSLRGFDR